MKNQLPVIEPHQLLKAWMPFRAALGVTSVHTAKDHAKASKVIAALLEEVAEDEEHPLAELLDYLANQVELYEARHLVIADAEPRDVLKLLMEQRGLGQSDLAEVMPQGRVSDILAGRRAISKAQAKALAQRFKVDAGVFL